MSHDAGRTCVCVKRHSPTPAELHRHHAHPLSMGGPEKGEAVWLCLPPGAPVLMANGSQTVIEEVEVGDRVIGHDLEPHAVTATMARPFAGQIVMVHGCAMTPDHLVLTGRGWVPAGCLRPVDRVVHVEPASTALPLVAVVAKAPSSVANIGRCTEAAAVELSGPSGDPAPTGVPSVAMMRPKVLGVRSQEFEVLGSVVRSVMVPVVDDLAGFQPSAQLLLHDPAVLGQLPPLATVPHDDVSVPLGVGPAFAGAFQGSRDSLQGSQAADVGAEHGDPSAADAGVGPPEGLSTFTAAPAPRLIRRSRMVGTAPRKFFRGHVYDLSVEGSHSFVADSIAVHNCPTSHVDTHELIRRWIQYNGQPPWQIRRYFGRYVQDLAERAYRAWDEAGRP